MSKSTCYLLYILLFLSFSSVAEQINRTDNSFAHYFIDINGDGQQDLFLHSRDSFVNSRYILATKVDGRITHPENNEVVLGTTIDGSNWSTEESQLVLADFTGDGKTDLYVVFQNQQKSYLIQTNHDGVLSLENIAVEYNIDSLPWLSVDTDFEYFSGDFNGDSFADLLVITVNQGQHLLLHADKNGRFSVKQRFNEKVKWGLNKTEKFYIADFNGDGKDDVFALARTKGKKHYVIFANDNGELVENNPKIIPAKIFDEEWQADDFSSILFNVEGKASSDIIRLQNAKGGYDEMDKYWPDSKLPLGIDDAQRTEAQFYDVESLDQCDQIIFSPLNEASSNTCSPYESKQFNAEKLVNTKNKMVPVTDFNIVGSVLMTEPCPFCDDNAPPPSTPTSSPHIAGGNYHAINTGITISVGAQTNAFWYEIYESHTNTNYQLIHGGNSNNLRVTRSYPTWGYVYYKYKVCNGTGCSGLSPWRRIRIYDTPGMTNISADPSIINSGQTSTISWPNPYHIIWVGTTYERYYVTPAGANVTMSILSHVSGVTSTSFTTPSLSLPGKYTFYVRACNPDVPCGAWGSTIISVKPLVPNSISAVKLSSEGNDIKVSWSPVTGASSYDREVSFDGVNWQNRNNYTTTSVTFYNQNVRSYYYRVRACHDNICSDFSSRSNKVTIYPIIVNTAPTITNIPNQTIDKDTNTGNIAFTIGDDETSVSSLLLSKSSSNAALIPSSNIMVGGSGANRTVRVTPVANQSGNSTITVTVSDGDLSSSNTFVVTVLEDEINTAPTITNIPNQTIDKGTNTGNIAFTIGDDETSVNSLLLSKSSSNVTLIPNSNITIGGSGANRTVRVTPAANKSGNATITVTISDGDLSSSNTFVVTVLEDEINTTPTITNIPNQTIDKDTNTGHIFFTIGDAETSAGSLILSKSSSNTTLIPSSNITFGGSGANRSVKLTPVANQSGNATITVTVSDGHSSSSDTFVIAVTAETLNLNWLSKNGSVTDWELNSSVPSDSTFVGAIAGSGSVSGGAGNYSIPVVIPPVLNGMQPNVSLNYSSRNGRGIAGVGWGLSAAGAISRCSATVAQDSFNHGVTYEAATDRLCLNGQRLVPLQGAYGQNGTTYATEIDSFITVIQSGGDINGTNTFFTVNLPTGHSQIFGNTIDSRVIPSGAPAVLSWLIDSETDASGGNAINYAYRDLSNGEVLLSSISYYAGRHVNFEYQDIGVNNYSTSYLGGGKTRQTQRLSTISTYVDQEIVRQYSLKYNFSQGTSRLLLSHVEECSYNGQTICRDALNNTETRFTYTNQQSTFKLEPLVMADGNELVQIPSNRYVPEIHLITPRGDIDGNGSLDWAGYSNGITEYDGHFVNAEGDNKGVNSFNYAPCSRNRITGQFVCLDADFNLDGVTDSWRITNNAMEIGYTEELTTNWNVAGITAVDLSNDEISVEHVLVNINDYNGDGWPDIIVHEGEYNSGTGQWLGDVYLYLHTKNISSPYSAASNYKKFVTHLLADESLQYIGDIDGDGITDLAFSELTMASNDSQPTMTALLLTSMDEQGLLNFNRVTLGNSGANSGLNSFENFSMLIDINGDGLSDWIGWMYGEEAKLYARINKGAGSFGDAFYLNYDLPKNQLFFPGVTPEEPDLTIIPKFMDAFKQMDINGDGRVELIMPGNSESDILVKSCYTFYEVKGTTASEVTKCGSDINQKYRMDAGGYIAYANPLSSWDRNIYKYVALTFKEDGAGNYTAEKIATDLIGSANHAAVVDAFGNGLSDLVFIYGCGDTSCEMISDDDGINGGYMENAAVNKVYFNRNYGATSNTTSPSASDYRAHDLLVSAVDGMQRVTSWNYWPLSSEAAGADFYQVDRSFVDDEHFLFASTMYAVSEFQYDTGAGNNTITYRYDNAMYNTQGRGFRGFEHIVESNDASNISVVTEFLQKFPYSSLIVKQSQFEGERTTPFSVTENNWLINTNHNVLDSYNVFNTKSISIECDLNAASCNTAGATLTRSENNIVLSDIDEWGNVLKSTATVTDLYGSYVKEKITDFSLATRDWPRRYESQRVISNNPTRTLGISPAADIDMKTWVESAVVWDITHRKPKTISMTTNDGSTTASVTTTYNALGLPEEVVASGENQTRTSSISYDSYGFVASKTNAAGHQTLMTADYKTGAPLSITDPNGLVSTTQYDALGRPTQITRSGMLPQYLRYYANDSSVPYAVMKNVVTQASTPEIIRYQDRQGRTLHVKTASFDGSYVYQDTVFNNRGLTTQASNLYNDTPNITSYEHDVLGRVTNKLSPKTHGGLLSTSYNYNGLVTTVNVAGLPSMSRTYNALKQLVQTADAIGGITQYAYDGRGNPVVIEDANTQQITAKYDALNRKAWVNDPNQGKTVFSYNDYGNLASELNANGQTITYTVDVLGRVTGRSGTEDATFEWDSLKKGLLSSQLSNGVVQSFGYDNYARVTQSSLLIDGNSYVTGYAYHGTSGQLKSMTYPNDVVLGYEYNNLGYLSKEYNVSSGYVYREITAQNAMGQITEATLGVDTQGSEDADIRQSMTYAQSTGQMFTSTATGQVSGAAGDIQNLSYSYDDFGNIFSQYNALSGLTATDTYSYDNLHRLISSTTSANGFNDSIYYDYDGVGNLLKKSDYSVNNASAYSYVAGTNQVSSVNLTGGGTDSFSYDDKGNQTHRNGVVEIAYNVFNKPSSINRNNTSIQFVYGADLARVKQTRVVAGKTITTYYVGKHYERETYEGNWRELSYISDAAIVRDGNQVGDKTIRFTLRDRLGSATTFADHLGNVTAYRYFDPFGKPRSGDWSPLSLLGLSAQLSNNPLDSDMSTRRGFTDHEHLDEAQLIHMNGRVYDYNLGRFLSVDPFIQAPGNSQSLNPYSYIMNNPLSGTDPSGYFSDTEEKPEEEATEETTEAFKPRKLKKHTAGTRLNRVTPKDNGANVSDITSGSTSNSITDINSEKEKNKGSTNAGGTPSGGGSLRDQIKSDSHNSIVRGGEELGVDMGGGVSDGVNAEWGSINRDGDGNITQASVVCGMSCRAEAGLYSYKHSMDLIRIRNQNDYGALANEALYEIGNAFSMAWGLGAGARYIASEWALLNSSKQAAVFSTMTHFQSLAYAEQLVHMQALLKAGQYGVPRARALLKLKEGEKIMKTKMRMKVRE